MSKEELEALEILEHISKEECLFRDRSTVYMDGEKVDSFTWKHTIGDHFRGGIEIIKQSLLTKSKKEQAFEKIQAIMDTWHTSYIMDNESALREIDKIICEVLK